ncbi:Uncharacterised protein [Mycobacteroides abscessus subsp. abscessus]|nr:Uncharacterised protein [Mycobacteroides abscessus subsp. abscessus]
MHFLRISNAKFRPNFFNFGNYITTTVNTDGVTYTHIQTVNFTNIM